MSVELIRSENKIADKLTRVPKSWLSGNDISTPLAADTITKNVGDSAFTETVSDIHSSHYLGVDRPWRLVKS